MWHHGQLLSGRRVDRCEPRQCRFGRDVFDQRLEQRHRVRLERSCGLDVAQVEQVRILADLVRVEAGELVDAEAHVGQLSALVGEVDSVPGDEEEADDRAVLIVRGGRKSPAIDTGFGPEEVVGVQCDQWRFDVIAAQDADCEPAGVDGQRTTDLLPGQVDPRPLGTVCRGCDAE